MNLLSSKKFIAFLLSLSALSIRFIHYNLIGYQPIVRNLVEQYDFRALKLVAGEPIFYSHAWGSFYIILAAFYKVFDLFGVLGAHITLMVLIQNVLAAASVGLLFLISQRYFSTALAVLNSFIFALYYPFIYINIMVVSETAAVFCSMLAFYLLLSEKLTVVKTLTIGITLGLAVISRPILLTFFPLLLIWLIVTSAKKTSTAQFLGLFLSFTLVILGANYINFLYGEQHQFKFTGSGGINFAMTNCQLKKAEYRTKDGESFWFAPPAYHKSTFQEINTEVPFYQDSYYFKMGLDCLKQNPVQLLTNLTNLYRIYDSTFYPSFHYSPVHTGLFTLWKWVSALLTFFFVAFPWVCRLKVKSKNLKNAYALSAIFFTSLFISVYWTNPGEERYLLTYFFVLPLFGVPACMVLITRLTKLSLKRLKPL